jgi:hypothetical protein
MVPSARPFFIQEDNMTDKLDAIKAVEKEAERIAFADGQTVGDTGPAGGVALDPETLMIMQAFSLAHFALSQAHLIFHPDGVVPDTELYEFACDAMNQINQASNKACALALKRKEGPAPDKTQLSMDMGPGDV